MERASTAIVVAVVAMLAATASAQTSSARQAGASSQLRHRPECAADGDSAPRRCDMTPAETRPATATFMGDTGLWFVPTARCCRPVLVVQLIARTSTTPKGSRTCPTGRSPSVPAFEQG